MLAINETRSLPSLCNFANTMTDDEPPLLYRQLMAIKPASMSVNEWLIAAKVNRSFFAGLRKRAKGNGGANQKTIGKLVEAAGMTMADFFALQAPPTEPEAIREEVRSAQLPFRSEAEARDIPVVGSALGHDMIFDEDGTRVFAEVTDLFLDEDNDYARRPAALQSRRDVYVVTVVGSSMMDRHEPGDPLYVDPKATPRLGDDVVVYLRRPEDDGERIYSALIKRLVKRSGTFVELLQLNPRVSFTVATKDIAMIHRVIPMREMVFF